MSSTTRTNRQRVMLVWWLGALVATVILLAHPYRDGSPDLSRRSPFDNTGSGHAEQWIFLSEATRHVPSHASFTVTAPNHETEMSLFMMAVGLLPEATPLPTSYYGQPTSIGDEVKFVLEFGEPTSDQRSRGPAIEVSGGRVKQRLSAGP